MTERELVDRLESLETTVDSLIEKADQIARAVAAIEVAVSQMEPQLAHMYRDHTYEPG